MGWIYRLLIFFICLFPSQIWAQINNPAFKKVLDSLCKQRVSLISIADFKKLNKSNLYILDTREESEFKVSHLKNARSIGYFWFDMRKVYDIPYEATVVVYCSVGNRGECIGEKLVNGGYKCVYNLYGGIFEWVNQGNPVYKSNGVQTSEVHPFGKKWIQWLERGVKR